MALPNSLFHIGDKVEVCSKQEGFVGSFFEATILGWVGSSRYGVRYKNLVTENDPNKKLKEIVRADEVRPRPPRTRASTFSLLQMVDAFDSDGWWVGCVSGKRGSDRYQVYFDLYGVEITYPASQLRPHQDWCNGQWVLTATSSQEEDDGGQS